MFDLAEKFPPFLAVYIFYDNNEVVCIKAVDLALKFDFLNGPARKTGGACPPVSISTTNDAWTCASK